MKSSGPRFCRRERLWCCAFKCIKLRLFDELWLAIYGPRGIRFYRSSSLKSLNLSTTGIATRHMGLEVRITGPSREDDPLKAMQVIDKKIREKGCDLVALVQWDAREAESHHHCSP